MGDEEVIAQLKEKIIDLEERLSAVEKEQRVMREDMLSGLARERMQRRILENTPRKNEELRKKIDIEAKIKI